MTGSTLRAQRPSEVAAIHDSHSARAESSNKSNGVRRESSELARLRKLVKVLTVLPPLNWLINSHVRRSVAETSVSFEEEGMSLSLPVLAGGGKKLEGRGQKAEDRG